jgi:hypothetical protein
MEKIKCFEQKQKQLLEAIGKTENLRIKTINIFLKVENDSDKQQY